MDHHHRRGIAALVALSLIVILYAHERTVNPLPTLAPLQPVPFAGEVPEPVFRGNVQNNQVIFTFDGGEGAQSASAIMDILARHNARGTFFLTGTWMSRNPLLVRRMVTEGHEVYSHTYSHPHLPGLEEQDIFRQLKMTDDMFMSLTGTTTKPYFRPPFGDYDARVLRTAARNGYRAIMWTVDAGDWMEEMGFTDEEIKARIYGGLAPGSIILMHVGDTATGRILDEVLTEVKGRGYTLTTLSAGL